MHECAHKPMIGHIVTALKKAGVDKIVVVVGHGADSVKEYLKDDVTYALTMSKYFSFLIIFSNNNYHQKY